MGDLVVDDGGQIESDIVLGHADLAGNLDNLDLDVNRPEILADGVHLDKARVDGTLEAEVGQFRVCASRTKKIRALRTVQIL